MNEKPNGGPAFPSGIVRKSRPAHDPGADFHVTDFTEPRNAGMTLRDYFAAKALQSFLAIPGASSCTEESIARAAYQQADAMLEERNKENLRNEPT